MNKRHFILAGVLVFLLAAFFARAATTQSKAGGDRLSVQRSDKESASWGFPTNDYYAWLTREDGQSVTESVKESASWGFPTNDYYAWLTREDGQLAAESDEELAETGALP